jgi:hypothetical protein
MAMTRAELEKMTAPKLRELTIEKYPAITGVSGMKKEELVEALIAEEVRLGLRPKEEKGQATASMGAVQLKAAIRKSKDHSNVGAARLQIKRMKRRQRKLRKAS